MVQQKKKKLPPTASLSDTRRLRQHFLHKSWLGHDESCRQLLTDCIAPPHPSPLQSHTYHNNNNNNNNNNADNNINNNDNNIIKQQQ